MFPNWRLKLRAARLAYRGGRYDEASSLLECSELREFLPAKRLARDVAARIAARAEGRMARGESRAGWQDVATANRLGGQEEALTRIRQRYAADTLAEVVRYLSAGEPGMARQRLSKLEKYGIAGGKTGPVRQIAELMGQAERTLAGGKYAAAVKSIRRAQSLAEQLELGEHGTMDLAKKLNEQAERAQQQADELNRLMGELHTALRDNQWSTVLSVAEAMLAIAPQHAAGIEARQRAWQAVGMEMTRSLGAVRSEPVSLAYGRPRCQRALRSTRRSIRTFEDDTVTGHENPQRDILWIDAVGGYLLCYDDHLVLGQPTHQQSIGLPILGDLSRRHAVIRRDGGSYTIEPVHTTYVDGRSLSGPTLLTDGQVIQLGDSVRLRFNKPHALSSTAVLTVESGHKTQPTADAIVLLADSCLLGPSNHCHIRCRDWQRDVILFRQGEGLMCRAGCEIRVDEVPAAGPVAIVPGERVEGDDFSFCVEET